MKHRYLQVTFRRGKAFAAYLYLLRKIGAKVVRSEERGRGLRADFDDSGAPVGIEITSPSLVTIADVNQLLTKLGVEQLPLEEWAPLRAA